MSVRRLSALLLSASLIVPLTVQATSPTKYMQVQTQAESAPTLVTPTQSNITFEDALNAYDSGDKLRALSYGKIAATNGSTEAQVLVGHILLRGEAGFIDAPQAARWYGMAENAENADALVALGEIALRGHGGLKPEHAIGYLYRATKLGRKDAMRVIADMYERGEGVAQDSELAKRWREKAAGDGDVLAARSMGDQLIDTNPKEALKWYEKAAAQGDPQSAYIAAIMLVENFEIRPNEAKSAKLLLQAAQAGFPPAMADYGLLVYQGAGVEQNTPLAASWFEKSAKAGDQEGQFLYAFILAKGEGVERNYEEAYFWLLRSGESSIAEYDADRQALKQRLDANIDPAIIARATSRFERTVQ